IRAKNSAASVSFSFGITDQTAVSSPSSAPSHAAHSGTPGNALSSPSASDPTVRHEGLASSKVSTPVPASVTWAALNPCFAAAHQVTDDVCVGRSTVATQTLPPGPEVAWTKESPPRDQVPPAIVGTSE